MKKRVEILGYVDDTSNTLEVKQEGTLIKFSTHMYGNYYKINSQEVALVQLDDGTFKSVNLSQIRLKEQ